MSELGRSIRACTHRRSQEAAIHLTREAHTSKLGKPIFVIIDFYHDERSGELGFPKRHLVPREKVVEEMTGAGYQLAKEHAILPKQYFLEFVGAEDH